MLGVLSLIHHEICLGCAKCRGGQLCRASGDGGLSADQAAALAAALVYQAGSCGAGGRRGRSALVSCHVHTVLRSMLLLPCTLGCLNL